MEHEVWNVRLRIERARLAKALQATLRLRKMPFAGRKNMEHEVWRGRLAAMVNIK